MSVLEYPDFEITEDILFNFEEFCDEKYLDPLVQQFGFFKVHLHSSIANQSSSVENFLEKFRREANDAVKETVVIANPVKNGLFGHHQVDALDHFRDTYMNSTTPDSFSTHDITDNCCMQVLADNGIEALTEHFYSKLESHAVALFRNNPSRRNMSTIQNKAVASKVAYEKRQCFQRKTTPSEKQRTLQLSLQLEKLEEGGPGIGCECDNCGYLNLELPGPSDNPVGFLYSAGIEESGSKYLHLTNNFAMAYLCHKNMLGELRSAYGGVSFPALYMGASHAVFPIHVEDMSLWSFNFVLKGFPKMWVIVPAYAVAMLTDALTRCGFGGVHRTCKNNLGHKFFIPTPDWLRRQNIPFNVVIQREGEGIVLLPNAAHTGGNLGNNLAEACNFGTKLWLPYGCIYPLCTCLNDSVHADLSQIVAVHNRALLKAYLNNDILNVCEEEYFQRSTVFARGAPSSSGILAFSSDADSLPRPGPRTERVKCPICRVSWATCQKRNILAHLNKFHSSQMDEEIVQTFLRDKFPRHGK